MAKLTAAQIYALAREAGFNAGEAATASAVALAESGGDTDAVGDTSLETAKWGPSVGLWQVRTLKAETGKGTTRDITWLRASPRNQAKAAFEIRSGRGGWSNWSVFTSGAYKTKVASVQTQTQQQAQVSGDAWWEKVLAVGGWADYLDPRSDGQSHAQAAAGSIENTVAGYGGLADAGRTFLETVNSPAWWKRVGIGAGGVALVILGVLLLLWTSKNKIIQGTVGSVVKGATK